MWNIKDLAFKFACFKNSKNLKGQVLKLFKQKLISAVQRIHFLLDQDDLTKDDMEIAESDFKMLMEYHLISEENEKQLSKLSKQNKKIIKKVVIPDVDSFVDQFKPGEF